jgi:HD-like signal output (HDOD) protein
MPSSLTQQEFDAAVVRLIASDQVTIPAYPAAADRLNRIISADKFSLGDLAGVTRVDQVLAATVLRLANSAAHRGRRQVTTIEDAVARLGARDLLKVALTVGLGAHACTSGALVAIKQDVWRRSLFSAEFCRQMAPLRNLREDEAHLCGLLHNFGQVVALATIEQILVRHPETAARSQEEWLQVVDQYKVELGLVIVEKWKLPEDVAAVVTDHPKPDDPHSIRMVDLVKTAQAVIRLLYATPHVTLADVEQVHELHDQAEHKFVTELLPDLPAIVEAVGPESLRGASVPSKVRPTFVPAAGDVPCALDLTVGRAHGQLSYRCELATDSGLCMTGSAPLDENSVVKCTVQDAEAPWDLWGYVLGCVAQGNIHQITLRFIGLDGEMKMRWDAVVARARRGMGEGSGESATPAGLAGLRSGSVVAVIDGHGSGNGDGDVHGGRSGEGPRAGSVPMRGSATPHAPVSWLLIALAVAILIASVWLAVVLGA